VAYTDGLPEVEDKKGNEFGQENLENYFVEQRLEKLPIIHQRLLNRIDNFASEKGFHDDLTLLTIQFGN
jgi:serine phosphatase RsbU (regulator of sigma subunit)